MVDNMPSAKWMMALVLFLAGASPLQADTSRPIPEDGGPTEVRIQIFVLDLDEIDSANQTFTANVYLEATWQDPRLKGDPGTGERRVPTAEIWHPRLQVLNQQRVWVTMEKVAEISEDGTVTYRQRGWGSFSQPLELREFPFDRQELTFQLVAAGFLDDEVTLAATVGSGIAGKLSVADWKVVDWKMDAEIPVPGPPGDLEEDASVALVLEVERRIGYYLIKVILPLVLIVAMSWVVFWIDARETGTKISVAITAMLTLIAYRFAVGANLPDVSYLTRLDYFIMVSTVLVYAALVVVVVTASYVSSDRVGVAHRVDRWARWLFALAFLVTAAETLVFGFVLG
jgi:hypothetical protein